MKCCVIMISVKQACLHLSEFAQGNAIKGKALARTQVLYLGTFPLFACCHPVTKALNLNGSSSSWDCRWEALWVMMEILWVMVETLCHGGGSVGQD